MTEHLLKFIGLLFVIALLSRFGSIGFLIGAAILLTGLWKLVE